MRLFWLLALGAMALVVSCAIPPATEEPAGPTSASSVFPTSSPVPATDEPVAPTMAAPSPPTSSSARATEELPTPTVIASPLPASSSTPVAPEATPSAAVSEIPDRTALPVTGAAGKRAVEYSYRIVHVYPHDRGAFTQGLVYEDGVFYEGTGLREESTLRQVRPETGDVLKLYSLPARYFGEGITIWGKRVIQLTLKAGLGFVYDKDSFDLMGVFSYPKEGWGLTHDGTRLIMSDGTSMLRFWEPETYEETGQVQVYDEYGPVIMLNELEHVRGKVYANVWQTDLVVIIDPKSGRVTGRIDLGGLLEPEDYAQPVDVLNGIAYDAEGDRLFVTGKKWPKLFEIELVPIATRVGRERPIAR